MGSISYFPDSPPESLSPSENQPVRPFTVLDSRSVHPTRNGYHCRALLLPYPHSLCSAILEPALTPTLLPDFSFLASFQLSLGPISAASASSAVPGQHDDEVENIPDPDPYSDSRPLHRRLYNPNHDQNFTLQQLSALSQRDIVFVYPEGGSGLEFLLRHGPCPQLVRAPGDENENDNDDRYTTQSQSQSQDERLPQLYPRFPSSPPPIQDQDQEETSNLEDIVRQMITHHPERRLEMTFDELIHGRSHPFASNDDSANYGLATTTDDGPEDPDPYPFRVPSVCFRIPNNPTSDDERRVDVMTLQRSRFLRSDEDEEAIGMVLGIAIHSTLADAAGVEVIVARLRRKVLREVGGVRSWWEERSQG